MPAFVNRNLAELAHQLTLSPRRLRFAQLAGIQKLLGLVERDASYPYEFVCYHITGYQKRGTAPSASLPGKALVSDLVALGEMLSRQAGLSVAEMPEPYLTHEQVAKELCVSTKTIRRWRARGLLGLRAVFPDAVNRLVFLRSAVDGFVKRNADLVARGASFSQLSVVERKQIVERARAILAERPLRMHALARVVAEETGRAVETVRYTLRRYEASGGQPPLFAGHGPGFASAREEAIWSCRAAGEAVASIARAFETSPEAIEAVLRAVQVRLWRHNPPEFIPNELFDAPHADALILEVPEPPEEVGTGRRAPGGVPAYLRSLYSIPLLTFAQEQDVFRRYNYLKYLAVRKIKSLKPETASAEDVEAVRALLARSDGIKQRIVRANLRLVVSIAKRHVGTGDDFFEVVSDGNMSMMRAVEKFDFARGNKFSTYATWAIMKNYARSIPEQRYHYHRYVTGQDELLESAADDRPAPVPADERQQVRQTLAAALDALDEREREIVTQHFGLSSQRESLTLEQLGTRFGVTKERIRQIERRALQQLREVLGPQVAFALGST
ncbi:MAG TPA: sigma-70 family RNA polymerase sigma factor [Phycisphaerae bacterium]|nr:sigma-70 family RNA polymerase sigma factor [Phycisphaerae bacterium]HNU45580.1 sigma-70 family RNA polymerase sigma factor [Phycisphaerae bacterium]